MMWTEGINFVNNCESGQAGEKGGNLMSEPTTLAILEWQGLWVPVLSAVSAIGGAVVGACVGGRISSRLQERNLEESRKMRDEELLRKNSGLSRAVVLKIVNICEGFEYVKFHCNRAIESAKENKTPICWRMMVLADLPPSETLTYEELGLIHEIGGDLDTALHMNRMWRGLRVVAGLFNDSLSELKEIYGSYGGVKIDAVNFVPNMSTDIPESKKFHLELKEQARDEEIKSMYSAAEKGGEISDNLLIFVQEIVNTKFDLDLNFKKSEEEPQLQVPPPSGV